MQCLLACMRNEYVVSSLYCEHPSENNEAKKQASVTSVPFCGGHHVYKTIWTAAVGNKKWLVKQKESALLTLTALEQLIVPG